MDDDISIEIDYSHSEDSLETSEIDQILPEDPIESFPIESPEKISCALCVIRKKGKAHGHPYYLENRRIFRQTVDQMSYISFIIVIYIVAFVII